MERLVNVFGPFPTTGARNNCVLMAMDYFIKWSKVYAVLEQIAAKMVKLLTEEFVFVCWRSSTVTRATTMAEVCNWLGIWKTQTTL